MPGKGIDSVALTLKGFSKLHSLLSNIGPLNRQPLPASLMLDSHQRKLNQALTLNSVGRHWESSALSCICRLWFVSSQGHRSCEGQGTPGSAAKLLLLNSKYKLVMLGSPFFLPSLGPSRPLIKRWFSGSRPSQLWRPLLRFEKLLLYRKVSKFRLQDGLQMQTFPVKRVISNNFSAAFCSSVRVQDDEPKLKVKRLCEGIFKHKRLKKERTPSKHKCL